MTSFLKDIKFASDSRNVCDYMGEHWGFQTNNVQLQAVNCCRCGNYKCVSQSGPLTLKIKCECSSVSDEDDMYALPSDNDSYSYNKELAAKMVLYEQMCAFMDVEKECDLLCEDVVGLILEYL
jgi:hypothetical protein